MSKHRIAVIAGDGIGTEVMPEGLRVLEAAASRFDIDLQFDHFDFSSCDYFEKHGEMLPDDWKDQIGGHDAIYFGAVGWPDKVPDHISLWGSLLLFRREFDQYINLRPARLMPGVIAPVVRRDGMGAVVEGVIGRFFTQAFRDRDPPEVATTRATILATDPQGYAGCCMAIAACMRPAGRHRGGWRRRPAIPSIQRARCGVGPETRAGRRIGPNKMGEGYGLAARLSTGRGLQCPQRFTERQTHVVRDRRIRRDGRAGQSAGG